jgi:ADP-ribosylation factor-binding protein GGA
MCPDRLLLCNDLINNALERFEACKVGDWSKAEALVASANPNQKAADLISFDAFADEGPLSGDGGLSLPPDSGSASSYRNQAAMTSSGLPLDLFTAPSPTPFSRALVSFLSRKHVSKLITTNAKTRSNGVFPKCCTAVSAASIYV